MSRNPYDAWYYRYLILPIANFFAAVQWTGLVSFMRGGKPGHNLTQEDWKLIAELLATDYYVILTRRKTHLTTYMIGIATLLKTGKWPHYTHAFMNVEGSVDDNQDFSEFKFMEATAIGVHPSTFQEVMDSDSVVFLKPKYYSKEEMTAAVDAILKQDGIPYDDLFSLADDSHQSCVETVRVALQKLPEYSIRMRVFEFMVQEEKNLTPQMYYDCPDFEAVLEIRR